MVEGGVNLPVQEWFVRDTDKCRGDLSDEIEEDWEASKPYKNGQWLRVVPDLPE